MKTINHFKKNLSPTCQGPSKSHIIQTISVNIHYLEPNTRYFHMIEEFSRFSNVMIIRGKDDSMKMFMKH